MNTATVINNEPEDQIIEPDGTYEYIGQTRMDEAERYGNLETGMKLTIQDYFYYGNPFEEENLRCRTTTVYLCDEGAIFKNKEEYELYGPYVHSHMDWMRFNHRYVNVEVHEDNLNNAINPGLLFFKGRAKYMFRHKYKKVPARERKPNPKNARIRYSKTDDGYGYKSFREDKKKYFVIKNEA